jgi:EAL and modified HD-GYP domain-containing signal transduction protein
MDVYIIRQPILDRGWNIAAYEFLCRPVDSDVASGTFGGTAIPQIMSNAGSELGSDRLLGNKAAFIRLDRNHVLGDCCSYPEPAKAIIEFAKTVLPDQETLSACERLHNSGYAIALGDCLDDQRTESFAHHVDILKVNFANASTLAQENLAKRYRGIDLRMVAANIRTEVEFVKASRLGYHYFQGLFFASEAVQQTPRVSASQTNGLRLINEVRRDELDFHAIELLIRHDLAFSHALLTYLNSASFHWAAHIESVRQALVLLGTDEIRKWVWIATFFALGQNRPPVLTAQVLMRGRFCEDIANCANLDLGETDPFLAGLLSLLDAILRRPLKETLDEINISNTMRDTLLGRGNEEDPLALVLGIVKAYERCEFRAVDAGAKAIHLSPDALNACYFRSLAWVECAYSVDEKTWSDAHIQPPADFHRRKGRLVCGKTPVTESGQALAFERSF